VLIEAEKTSFPVAVMCRALAVSRTGFHDCERRAPSNRALSDAWLAERMKQVHAASDGTYGARRGYAALRVEHQIRVGRKCVEWLMKAVERDFADCSEPDVVDGHHLHLDLGGVLYLAHVQDLFSRLIVGWSMADYLRSELGSPRERQHRRLWGQCEAPFDRYSADLLARDVRGWHMRGWEVRKPPPA
jgi:putative transposase